jgi:hypothetical protein
MELVSFPINLAGFVNGRQFLGRLKIPSRSQGNSNIPLNFLLALLKQERRLALDDVQGRAIVIPITPAFEAKVVLFCQWFDEAHRRVLRETREKLRAEGIPVEEIIEVPEKASLKGRLVLHHCSATFS